MAAEQWIRREMDVLIECFDLCSRGSDQFPAGSPISGVFHEEVASQACQATLFLFVSQNELNELNELNEFEETNPENSVPEPEITISEFDNPRKDFSSHSGETPSDIPAELERSGKWIEPEMSRKVLEWILLAGFYCRRFQERIDQIQRENQQLHDQVGFSLQF